MQCYQAISIHGVRHSYALYVVQWYNDLHMIFLRCDFLIAAAAAVEEMESDDEDEHPVVSIGDQRVPYHEVTQEMVQQMTAAEKDAYIKMGQEMYEDMYD